MDTSVEYIPVGKISGAFGVKGWVKVYSFTDPRENILSYSPLYLSRKGEWVEVKVVEGRLQGKGVVMSLSGVTDRDQVLPLVGVELAIAKTQIKPAGKDEYYWSDLIGMSVVLSNTAPSNNKEFATTISPDINALIEKSLAINTQVSV